MLFLEQLAAAVGAAMPCPPFCEQFTVGGAYDPCYAEAYEAGNSAYLNHGVAVMKYTGARGKSGSSDASAKLPAKRRGYSAKPAASADL